MSVLSPSAHDGGLGSGVSVLSPSAHDVGLGCLYCHPHHMTGVWGVGCGVSVLSPSSHDGGLGSGVSVLSPSSHDGGLGCGVWGVCTVTLIT